MLIQFCNLMQRINDCMVCKNSLVDWLEKDKHEWTDKKMIFEITTIGDKTVLRSTLGELFPDLECYKKGEQSWNTYIKEKLFTFITKG